MLSLIALFNAITATTALADRLPQSHQLTVALMKPATKPAAAICNNVCPITHQCLDKH